VLTAAAFVPHPPLIMPEVAAGAAAELDELRSACARAVRALLASRPELVVVIGADPASARPARWSDGDGGSMAGYGLDLVVPLAGAVRPGRCGMPLSVTVGAWLLARFGHPGDRLGFTVPAGADATELAGWAAELADLADRLGVLVAGDGSARRSVAAPGYVDPRAAGFDAAVAAALAGADAAALRELDPRLGADLLAAGVPAWRLAGHLAAAAGAAPGTLSGELLHDAAPYGVGYLVATWLPAGGRPARGGGGGGPAGAGRRGGQRRLDAAVPGHGHRHREAHPGRAPRHPAPPARHLAGHR
jgi:hypothetical protein